MSCPDWGLLVAERERAELAGDLEPGDAWRSAVDHLAGCAACRRTALALDPSLLFVAQPPLEVSDDEIERIKANVRTLRRARRAERASGAAGRRLGRVAAAAAAVALMVLLPTHTDRPPVPAPAAATDLAAESGAAVPDNLVLGGAPAPMIEPLDLPLARIYQLGADDLPVVMVVDESIDV